MSVLPFLWVKCFYQNFGKNCQKSWRTLVWMNISSTFCRFELMSGRTNVLGPLICSYCSYFRGCCYTVTFKFILIFFSFKNSASRASADKINLSANRPLGLLFPVRHRDTESSPSIDFVSLGHFIVSLDFKYKKYIDRYKIKKI